MKTNESLSKTCLPLNYNHSIQFTFVNHHSLFVLSFNVMALKEIKTITINR